MSRISRPQMWMEMTNIAAKRATCFRENVGCLIVKNDDVVSMGYNGPPSGEPHCESHPDGRCLRSRHAEINAMERAIDKGVIGPCDLYATHLPCPICSGAISSSGLIGRIFFQTVYGDPNETFRIVEQRGIELYRILPCGTITDHNRTKVLDVK